MPQDKSGTSWPINLNTSNHRSASQGSFFLYPIPSLKQAAATGMRPSL